MQPVRTSTITATPEVAKKWIELAVYERDRPLKPKLLTLLKKAIEDGEFRTTIWAKAKLDGIWYRVNGKHTSYLMAQIPKLPKITIHLEEYEVNTPEEMAALYSTFDTRESSRSCADVYRVYAASNPALKDVSARVIGLCVTGLAFDKWEEEYTHRASLQERAELLLENPKFVVWADELLRHGNSKNTLLRGGVVAAMARTFHKSQADATLFWTAVRDGTGTTPKKPDRVLQKWLLSVAVRFGGGMQTGKKMADGREMFARCIHAWNAWRKQEVTELKYYSDKGLPKAS
jgi:hypothetical protein